MCLMYVWTAPEYHDLISFLFYSVKNKQKQAVALENAQEPIRTKNSRVMKRTEAKLQKAQDRIREERERWEKKDAALQNDLSACQDKVYLLKRRHRDLISEQVAKAREKEVEQYFAGPQGSSVQECEGTALSRTTQTKVAQREGTSSIGGG